MIRKHRPQIVLAPYYHLPIGRGLGHNDHYKTGQIVANGFNLAHLRKAPVEGEAYQAKAIYYFGGFDQQFFRELINQAYPPLVPVLEGAAFHFMGAPDVVTLHLQFWFLLVGFVGAVVGLLSGRVSPVFVWPPLLLMLVAPHVGGHFYQPTADFLLDELFAIAALLIALWLIDRKEWQLVAAGLLLAAVMSTKREGYAFAASAISF